MNINNIRQNFTQNGAAIITLLVLGMLIIALSFRKQKGFSKGEPAPQAFAMQPAGQS